MARTPILLCTDGDEVVEVFQVNGEYRCTCVGQAVVALMFKPDVLQCSHVKWVEAQIETGFWRYTFDGPYYEVKADTPEALREWLLTHLHVFDCATEMV